MKTTLLSCCYDLLAWLHSRSGLAAAACRKRLDRALLDDLDSRRAARRAARRRFWRNNPLGGGLLALLLGVSAVMATLLCWAALVIVFSF